MQIKQDNYFNNIEITIYFTIINNIIAFIITTKLYICYLKPFINNINIYERLMLVFPILSIFVLINLKIKINKQTIKLNAFFKHLVLFIFNTVSISFVFLVILNTTLNHHIFHYIKYWLFLTLISFFAFLIIYALLYNFPVLSKTKINKKYKDNTNSLIYFTYCSIIVISIYYFYINKAFNFYTYYAYLSSQEFYIVTIIFLLILFIIKSIPYSFISEYVEYIADIDNIIDKIYPTESKHVNFIRTQPLSKQANQYYINQYIRTEHIKNKWKNILAYTYILNTNILEIQKHSLILSNSLINKTICAILRQL